MHLTPYVITITLASWIILGLNYFFPPENVSTFWNLFWGFLGPWALIGTDAAAALIAHSLPRKWMNPYRKCFTPFKRELSMLRKSKLTTWKNFVPDTGKITCGFSKEHIDGTDPKYLYMFLEETCYAEWVHYAMAFSSFLLFIYTPKALWLTMILPQVCFNFLLNWPPVLIQRFNRPKLLVMYERNLKKCSSVEQINKKV